MARRYSIGDNVYIPKLNEQGIIVKIEKVFVTGLTFYKYIIKTQNNKHIKACEYQIRMVQDMYRYVIRGKACAWQKGDTSVAKMKYIADMMNEQFGNDWYIEFKGE